MESKKFYQRPLFWFLIIFSIWGVINSVSIGESSKVIDSDGKGYYAFLPAIFIFNDSTYEKSVNAENEYLKGEHYPSYIKQNEQGKRFNNYFVGVAVLEFPFFFLATIISWIVGCSVTGYSDLYSAFYYLGGLFYSILGIVYFFKTVQLLFPEKKYIDWFVIIAIVCSPLIYYLAGSSMSHNFSFFLFAIFAYTLLILKERFSMGRFGLLGLILGLIIIVRPTNAIIVSLIPFLLGSKDNLVNFFKIAIVRYSNFTFALFCFSFVIFLQLLTWKWQSGNWFLWSYGGQGFNWSNPQILRSLIGFRTGLLVHSPIVILGIIGAIMMIRKNAFQALFWWIYFLLNSYVISSWWCWDYATTFGARAFSEHVIFILIPMIYLFNEWKKSLIIVFTVLTSLGIIRLAEKKSGFMSDQRFTTNNYFESLKFWKLENENRWQTLQALPPYGTLITQKELVSSEYAMIDSMNEFAHGAEVDLKNFPKDARYFINAEFDKKWIKGNSDNAFFVIDIYSSVTNKRNYLAIPLYHDKLEDNGKWVHLKIQDHAVDNFYEFDKLKCYIWNSNRSKFELRNFKCELRVYE